MTACQQHGWKLLSSENCTGRAETLLRIQISDGPPMIALWGSETIAGIPINVVFQDDVTLPILESTWKEFDSRFLHASRICEGQCGPPTIAGKYSTDWTTHEFRFAFFQCRCSTLVILQHDEGDGHLGNDASLDLRIIPKRADEIRLPLTTNLIF